MQLLAILVGVCLVHPARQSYSFADNEANGGEDYDGDEGLRTLPPGEEGFWQSHAGGEAIFPMILIRSKFIVLSRT
jgi:hypothetical protein